jgi:cell wall assembly regulator SMI1
MVLRNIFRITGCVNREKGQTISTTRGIRMRTKFKFAFSGPDNLAIQDIWREIEAWYKKNVPGILENLKHPASDEQIKEFEARLGISLPPDYRASLKTHNGDHNFHDYHYLYIDGALKKWQMLTKLGEDGTFEGWRVEEAHRGIIQNTWWHRAWIPFAEDGCGNLLCIDMAPGANGVEGQVIRMELRTGPESSGHKSFFSWLQRYKDDLYAGRYEVDEFGFIIEKL